MPVAGAWLLDTNILLRMSKSDDPHHPVISGALRALVAQGARLCFTSQTLGEFWNAATRPLDQNGFGLSTAETDRIARVIERDLEFLPDSRDRGDEELGRSATLNPNESDAWGFAAPQYLLG
jgi:predicted nucleic acid-binding protein